MRWHSPRERTAGTVTAEFAVAVPAVLLVLAGCLGGLRFGVEQIRVTAAAAAASRAAARDEAPGVAAHAVDPEAVLGGTTTRGDLRCTEVRASVPLLGVPVPVAASSCALAAEVP